MKGTLKTFSLLICIILVDAKTPTLSACSSEEGTTYKRWSNSCGNGCKWCKLGSFWYGVVTTTCHWMQQEEAKKFEKYLENQQNNYLLEENIYTNENVQKLYDEYQKFKGRKEAR